jgi:hypothetical protein
MPENNKNVEIIENYKNLNTDVIINKQGEEVKELSFFEEKYNKLKLAFESLLDYWGDYGYTDPVYVTQPVVIDQVPVYRNTVGEEKNENNDYWN